MPLDANDHLHFPEQQEEYKRVNRLCLECGRVFEQPSLRVLRVIDVDAALRPKDRRMTGDALVHTGNAGTAITGLSRQSQASPSDLDTASRLARLVPAPLIFQPQDWTFLTELPAGVERERVLAEVAECLCDRYAQCYETHYFQDIATFLHHMFEGIPELPIRMIDNYVKRPDERQRSFAPVFLIDAYRVDPAATVRRWQALLEGPTGEVATEALEVLNYAVNEKMLQPGHRRVLEGAARRLRALLV